MIISLSINYIVIVMRLLFYNKFTVRNTLVPALNISRISPESVNFSFLINLLQTAMWTLMELSNYNKIMSESHFRIHLCPQFFASRLRSVLL